MITADPILNEQLSRRGTPEAFGEYLRARRRGWLAEKLAAFIGRSRRLRLLPSGDTKGQHSAGLQSVPIRAIRGSESRTRDFDLDFNPLTEHTQERWMRLFRARQSGERLPPVTLTRRGDTFYVRDGHHWISIARSLGEDYIEAEVTMQE
jgi:hypothetical protein